MDENDIRFFCAVKALIFYKMKFLIILRSAQARGHNGLWELPGGRVQFNELPVNALHREIKEETGLNITLLFPVGVWSFLKNEKTQIIGITLVCRTASDKVVLSYEHDDYRWITNDQINQFTFFNGLKKDMDEWNWKKIIADVYGN